MQLHELQREHPLKKPKRIGRGGKKGTYCGRGVKGQKARAGRRLKPIIREILKKYPKLRGYRFKAKKEIAILNLDTLERVFNAQDVVNPEILVEKRLVRKIDGKIPIVKILGKGDLTKPLIIENCLLSAKAKEKIEKVGGKIK